MPPIHKQLNFPNLKGTTDTTGLSSEPTKSQGHNAHGHHASMGQGGTAGAQGVGNSMIPVGQPNKQIKINSAGVGSTNAKYYLSVPNPPTNERNNGMMSNHDLMMNRKTVGQHNSLGVGGGVISPPDVMLPSPNGRLRDLTKNGS